MKSGSLLRRTPLARKTRLRSRGPRINRNEPGRAEWKTTVSGFCQCGCSPPNFSLHLHRHHCVLEQHVRAEGGDPWDQANSILLHPDCHRRHHDAIHRIPLPSIPDGAVAFAADLFKSVEKAALYLRRYYRVEVDTEGWTP